jgi:hypothetical protein
MIDSKLLELRHTLTKIELAMANEKLHDKTRALAARAHTLVQRNAEAAMLRTLEALERPDVLQ